MSFLDLPPSAVLARDIDAKTAAKINTPGSATQVALAATYALIGAPAGNALAKWAPNTAYGAGVQTISPAGDIVSAKVAFTSGAVYDAANWNQSTQDGRLGALESGKWMRGEIPNGTDLASTTILAAGLYTISSNAVGDTILNRPAPVGNSRQGLLESLKSAGGHHRYRYSTQYNVYEKTFKASAWTAWRIIDDTAIEMVAADNLNNLKTPGWYCVSFASTGNQITGWPSGMGTKTGLIRVQQLFNGGTGWSQTIYPLSATQLWVRTGGAAWNAWADATAAPPAQVNNPYVGLANSLRVDDFSDRRGGRKKTGGIGAVAFRFDHGLLNYRDHIRGPLLAAGIVGSLALCSRQWGAAENTGVTQANVDAWVAAGEVEIWNHSATHADASTYEALTDTIVTGLSELRAQLPAAVVDGFVIPGVGGGTNLGGLNGGTKPAEFFGTDAGRLILENHAVSTGSYPGTDRRILDGRVRQGMGHQTIDTLTAAQVIAQIDLAKSEKSGVQLMLHPSTITTGTLTVAGFQQVVDYVVAERDAGRIKVYSPYDLLLADATV